METYIILFALGGTQLIILTAIAAVLRQVKKGNKDQQEIKTRLAWIKKRQLGK